MDRLRAGEERQGIKRDCGDEGSDRHRRVFSALPSAVPIAGICFLGEIDSEPGTRLLRSEPRVSPLLHRSPFPQKHRNGECPRK